jgi:hypothetical protein
MACGARAEMPRTQSSSRSDAGRSFMREKRSPVRHRQQHGCAQLLPDIGSHVTPSRDARATTTAGLDRRAATVSQIASSATDAVVRRPSPCPIRPESRVFAKAGPAVLDSAHRRERPRIPRAGLPASRGSDQLCAVSKALAAGEPVAMPKPTDEPRIPRIASLSAASARRASCEETRASGDGFAGHAEGVTRSSGWERATAWSPSGRAGAPITLGALRATRAQNTPRLKRLRNRHVTPDSRESATAAPASPNVAEASRCSQPRDGLSANHRCGRPSDARLAPDRRQRHAVDETAS